MPQLARQLGDRAEGGLVLFQVDQADEVALHAGPSPNCSCDIPAAEATKEAQKAGIKAAREAEDSAVKYRGRKPTFDVEQLHRTHELLAMGWTPSAISAEIGIPRATVYRIKEDPAKAAGLLETWGLAKLRCRPSPRVSAAVSPTARAAAALHRCGQDSTLTPIQGALRPCAPA